MSAVISASAAAATTMSARTAQDSAASVAVEVTSSPERVGPPDTTYYMKLGYIVAGAIFAAYILLMLRRIASVRRGS